MQVMVSVGYQALPEREDELLAALQDARFSRRRTGASSWRTWQDSSQPGRVLEQFVVASWQDLLQHARVTEPDQQRYDAIRSMTDPAHPTTVTHWVTPQLRRAGRSPSDSPGT